METHSPSGGKNTKEALVEKLHDMKHGISIQQFSDNIWKYYRKKYRDMPWRTNPIPYWVFISEVMLQQTQVSRVLEKFLPFIHTFPDFYTLGSASLADVFQYWQGLGYNRRALYLRDSARIICTQYDRILPNNTDILQQLPGIGTATAASIAVFTYNIPLPFIETNIRRVMLHSFFPDKTEVHDKELFPFIHKTMDRKRPREWYWALMDYGVYLKQKSGNINRRSRHYVKQAPYQDSNRQIRGAVLRVLSTQGGAVAEELPTYMNFPTDKILHVVEQLKTDGLVRSHHTGKLYISD